MANNKQRNSKNKSGKSTPPPSSKGHDVKNKPEPSSQANDCKYVKQEPPDIFVNIPPPEKEKWSWANKISVFSILVNITLAVFTYLLFREAGAQSKQAIRAADAADSAVRQNKRANDLNEKEFEIANMPYLQSSAFRMRFFDSQKKIEFSDSLSNIGRQIAELTKSEAIDRVGYGFGPYEEFMKVMGVGNSRTLFIPLYVAPDHVSPFQFEITYNDTTYQYIKEGKNIVYIYLKINYRNVTNDKERQYQLLYEIKYDPIKRYGQNHLFRSKNIDLPDSSKHSDPVISH